VWRQYRVAAIPVVLFLKAGYMQQFFILTPCLDVIRYIDDTILSVAGQVGDFSIHYHVQDGGSSDGTVDRLEYWSRQLGSGGFPVFCRNLEFSWSSGPDTGIYDAINRGFGGHARDMDDATMMSWINAGDRLEQGALQTVGAICRLHPMIPWLSGGLAHINDAGSPVRYSPGGTAVSQRALAAGLYEGRRLGFLQQEGVFWSHALWKTAGGAIAAGLRLAGDYQLWRQFAQHTPCFRVHTVTGAFRLHAGGLSRDFRAYNDEVDRLMSGAAGELRDDTWHELLELQRQGDRQGMIRAGFNGPVVVWNETGATWDVMGSVIEPGNIVTG
jgi:hypothetical protein